MRTHKYNLVELTQSLVRDFAEITSLHLFGSRRYRTMSLRSDCDILVTTDSHIPPHRLRDFSEFNCPALDFFIVTGNRAVSCINDSYVFAESYEALIHKLDAIEFWRRDVGLLHGADIDWLIETHTEAYFPPTCLPNSFLESRSITSHWKTIGELGLPVCPYIGDTVEKVSNFILDVVERTIMKSSDLGQKGDAKNGWTVHLSSEYDFQNLFFTVIKPWLPSLGREEVTIRYDDQNKIADFNLFGNQIVVEMKYIKDSVTKAAVLKTLEGLKIFYRNHPNVRALLFLILVKRSVDFDKAKIESDFSYPAHTPRVITKVVFCD